MISIQNLSKAFPSSGGHGPVFADISIGIPAGQFVSLVGASGCGKTTLLRCLAGLDRPDSGVIHWAGEMPSARGRRAVMVFQDYVNSLLPWKTVLGNVLFGMSADGSPERDKQVRAIRHLEDVGLGVHHARYPWQLSGGMQQRVTIARALAAGTDCLLMDEPFASLDAQVRAELEDLLLALWARRAKTILFVTHDVDEAIHLSDRVLVMGGSPAHILADLAIPLPRPRHQVQTRGLPEFSALRETVHTILRDGARA